MIHIARGPEPAALAPIREDRLVAARGAILKGTKIDFTEYDIVKQDLAAMQHNKCCYCEKREEQAKYRDVEHYRPIVALLVARLDLGKPPLRLHRLQP